MRKNKVFKIFLFVLILFLGSSRYKSYAGCAPGYYCYGTTVQDIMAGCNVFDKYCIQKYIYDDYVVCDSDCGKTVRGQKCEIETYSCGWVPNEVNPDILDWVCDCSTSTVDQTFNCCAGCTCGPWSGWGECSVLCGGGTQCRTRVCVDDCDVEKECRDCNTQPCGYNLEISVKNAQDDTSCEGDWKNGPPESGARVTIYKKSDGSTDLIFSGDTDSDGKVLVEDVPISDPTVLNIQVSKKSDDGTYYRLICPTLLVLEVNLSPKSGETIPINLGIVPIDAKSWKTVIDGDLYAVGVGVDISEGGKLGGFSNFLINQGISDSGGYALSSLDFTTSHDRIIEDKGGYAASFGSNHNDKDLERLTFNPPDHAEIIENLSHPFEDGGVYSIAVSDFNDSLENSDVIYSISPGPSGIAILYVTNIKVLPSGLSVSTTGPNPLYFEHSLTTSGSGRLILVIQSDDTYISKDIGYADFLTGTYTINSQPNIQGAIISKGNITFDTKTFNPAAARGDPVELDMPIMMLGPLVSRLNIALNRDLGASANDNYPAISIQHDQTLMCKISDLEKSKASEGYRNYTGLRTFDVQFDYAY